MFYSTETYSQDISLLLKQAFMQQDASVLSGFIDNDAKLILPNKEYDGSKQDFIKGLNEFIKRNPPLSFTEKFESGKQHSNFMIRTLRTKNEYFRVTVFMKKQASGQKINLMRIETENEPRF
jgi:hypothetical protein